MTRTKWMMWESRRRQCPALPSRTQQSHRLLMAKKRVPPRQQRRTQLQQLRNHHHHHRHQHQLKRNQLLASNQNAQETAPATVREPRTHARDTVSSSNRVVRILFAPIVEPRPHPFGVVTAVATRSAMPVDCISSCTMYIGP